MDCIDLLTVCVAACMLAVDLQAAEELAKHVPRVVQVAAVSASSSGATAYHVVDAIETYFALVEANGAQ